MTIYPRFLYMFSDVVCYATRNQADSALKLLEIRCTWEEGTDCGAPPLRPRRDGADADQGGVPGTAAFEEYSD